VYSESCKFNRLFEGGVDTTVGDSNLGTRWKDGWWVKASTQNKEYHLTRGEGRKVEYKRVCIGDFKIEGTEEGNCIDLVVD